MCGDWVDMRDVWNTLPYVHKSSDTRLLKGKLIALSGSGLYSVTRLYRVERGETRACKF